VKTHFFFHTCKPLYSPEPNGIQGCVLRYCAETLCRPLQEIFILSLKTCNFPHRWKGSYVIPLHKMRIKFWRMSYRGMWKLSAIPKLFENIITHRSEHSYRSLNSARQHGFIKRRSTTTILLDYTLFATNRFEKNFLTDVVCTDFSKAFDSVNHPLSMWSSFFNLKLLEW